MPTYFALLRNAVRTMPAMRTEWPTPGAVLKAPGNPARVAGAASRNPHDTCCFRSRRPTRAQDARDACHRLRRRGTERQAAVSRRIEGTRRSAKPGGRQRVDVGGFRKFLLSIWLPLRQLGQSSGGLRPAVTRIKEGVECIGFVGCHQGTAVVRDRLAAVHPTRGWSSAWCWSPTALLGTRN